MKLIEYHFMGGPLFMSILSFLFLIAIVLAGIKAFHLFIRIPDSDSKKRRGLPEIIQVGTFALFTGILGQVIGLFDAFKAMEGMDSIPLPLLAGGLKVSTITTIYGCIIFAISAILWFLLNQRYQNLINETSE